MRHESVDKIFKLTEKKKNDHMQEDSNPGRWITYRESVLDVLAKTP